MSLEQETMAKNNYLSKSQIKRILQWKDGVEASLNQTQTNDIVLPKIPASREVKVLLSYQIFGVRIKKLF